MVYGYIKGYVNLTCEAEAEPKAEFFWYRHGKRLLPRSHTIFTGIHSSILQVICFLGRLWILHDIKFVLQIHITSNTSMGEYKCKIRNKIGEIEHMITLKEGTKPEKPKMVFYPYCFKAIIQC